MSAPAIGEVIADKYRVERLLGQGGMGAVLAATHLHLGSQVAIKCLLPEVARIPEALARFVQEARTCAKLRSEFIVRVYDVGSLPSGAPFLVMELLDGKDLADHLRDRGPLPIDEVVGYAIEACEGLAEAHAEGIVHRDLKPSNLFIVPRKSGGRGSVKILDFGISKLMHAPEGPGSHSQTSSGSLLGSPYYMSPEQIDNPASVDARADLWSLGVVLFELLTGQRPFAAESAPSLLVKILHEPAPPLSSRRPDAPPWLEAIVARCLQKNPAQRFQNVIGLAQALRAGPHGDPLGVTAVGPSSLTPGPLSSADTAAILARRQLAHGDTHPSAPSVCLSVAYPERYHQPTVCLSIAQPPTPTSSRRGLLAGGAAVVAAGAAFGGWALYKRKQPITIKGSSTLGQQLLPKWQAGLDHEGISVEVSSAGTSRGIDALLSEGGSLLAAASRRATPEEQTRGKGKLVEHLVGYDAIAIVAHVDNPLPRLSLQQLRDIFSGKTSDWSALGQPPSPIHVLLRPEELGGHEALRNLLGNDLKFVDGAEVVRTNDELLRRIRADRHALSFASFTVTGPVRQIPVGKSDEGPFVTPSTTSVRQGTYPLVRPLIFYSWGPPQGAQKKFLQFTRSSAAQDALLGAGFIPLR